MEAKHEVVSYGSLEEAQAVHGDIIVSKMACLVKELEDGSKKRRLIMDLLRSGSNSLARVPERVVLPRGQDAAGDARTLLFFCEGGGFAEMMVLDVKDAFYSMGVHPSERRFQCIQGPDGRIYIFCVLSMGGAASPLVWGRAAAWTMRLSSAVWDVTQLRLQCFVDDPWAVARGSRRRRHHLLAVVALFWCSLGLRMSWKKMQYGPQVTWIGLKMSLSLEDVVLSLPEKFQTKALREVQAILQLEAVPVARLRSLVGTLMWMTGVVLWIRQSSHHYGRR